MELLRQWAASHLAPRLLGLSVNLYAPRITGLFRQGTLTVERSMTGTLTSCTGPRRPDSRRGESFL